MTNIGATIRSFLKAKKLTQRAAAELSGMTPQQFGDVVLCQKSPTLTTLQRIADGLDCDLIVKLKPRRRQRGIDAKGEM